MLNSLPAALTAAEVELPPRVQHELLRIAQEDHARPYADLGRLNAACATATLKRRDQSARIRYSMLSILEPLSQTTKCLIGPRRGR
jgi:hypothetical protein